MPRSEGCYRPGQHNTVTCHRWTTNGFDAITAIEPITATLPNLDAD
jgi:hypothetical protein